MTDSAKRLAMVMLKVERADEHIADVATSIRSFLATNPYRVIHQVDAKLGEAGGWVVDSVVDVPLSISCICGDAIQNLMSALDHLMQQIWNARNPGSTNKECGFPVAGNAARYKAMLRGEKKLLRADVIGGLRELEAYKGGKGHEFFVLNYLNSIDKHRLVLAVGSAHTMVNVGRDSFSRMLEPFKNDPGHWMHSIPRLDVWLRPADIQCPLKVGDVLLGNVGKDNVDAQKDFAFDVALNEPQVCEPKSIIETLKHFSGLVRGTINSFSGCLQ